MPDRTKMTDTGFSPKTPNPTSFGEMGWAHFPEAADAKAPLQRCAEKREAWLLLARQVVESCYKVDLSTYRPERLVEANAVKSIVRALFRLDPDAVALGLATTTTLRAALERHSAPLYTAPPYTYIHLPSDESERNALHMDVYGDFTTEHYTLWIPLNDCFHAPMTVAPGTHRRISLLKLLSAIERNFRLPEFPFFVPRLISPDIRLGEFLAWDARLHHAGNLNKTAVPHAALNFKLRAKPIPFEPSSTVIDAQMASPPTEREAAQFAEAYLRCFSDIRNAAVFSQQGPLLGEAVSEITALTESWALPEDDRRRVSFGFTLGTMRRDPHDVEAARLNLAASVLWPEFLWSLNSFLDFAYKAFGASAVSDFMEYYITRHPWEQVSALMRDVPNRLPGVSVPAKARETLPVLGWARRAADAT